ncbi:MAG: hypothetical protein JEZ02_14360 [Desulfatibacillum sp.]|nr:hypothetical protein [Desulfatibacillum sp.]
MNQSKARLTVSSTNAWLLLPWLAFLGATAQNVADPDLFGYLAFGRLFFESPAFPYVDVFSYYPVKNPWVYHEWLTGVVFYKMYVLVGPWALQALKYFLALGCMGLAWKTARLNGADKRAAAMCMLMAVWVAAQGWSPIRAQAFTYFFFSLVLYILERTRRGGNPKVLWMLVPVFGFWSNLHGGFLAGLGIFLIYGCCQWIEGGQGIPYKAEKRPVRTYGIVFGLSVLITLCNPYGLDYWVYLCRSLFMPRPFIVEWWSLPKTMIQGFYLPASFLFLGMVFWVAAMLGKILKSNISAGVALVILGLLGFMHHRHGVFFALGFVALVPPYTKWKKPGRFHEWMGAGLIAVCLLANGLLGGYQGVFLFSGSPFALKTPALDQAPFNALYYPSGAVETIRQSGLEGNVLADFHWGEYLMWNLYPECKVAVDGRYETVYPEGVVHEHFLCFENPQVGQEAFFAYLEKHPTSMIIATAGGRAHWLLMQAPDWSPVYQDRGCVLFIKTINRGKAREF